MALPSVVLPASFSIFLFPYDNLNPSHGPYSRLFLTLSASSKLGSGFLSRTDQVQGFSIGGYGRLVLEWQGRAKSFVFLPLPPLDGRWSGPGPARLVKSHRGTSRSAQPGWPPPPPPLRSPLNRPSLVHPLMFSISPHSSSINGSTNRAARSPVQARPTEIGPGQALSKRGRGLSIVMSSVSWQTTVVGIPHDDLMKT